MANQNSQLRNSSEIPSIFWFGDKLLIMVLINHTYTTIQNFGVRFFFKNYKFQQECIKLIKSDSKDIYNIKRFLFQINDVHLTFSSSKSIMVFTKILSSKKKINIDNKKKCFWPPNQHIRMIWWFLKNHVTLKTGVMALKIQLCHHRNNILKYNPIETCYF